LLAKLNNLKNMTTQKPNESRKDYLLRVTLAFLRDNWEAAECTTDYDGTTCDGACLADDIESAIEEDDYLANDKVSQPHGNNAQPL
jgi:hypothetical protein